MARALRTAIVCALVAWAGVASAQEWQGTAKMSGKVVDEAGKALEGVTVKLVYVAVKTGPELTTNAKGEWKVEKIANGMWNVEFYKEGFDLKGVAGVDVGGRVKEPKIDMKMTKEGTDPTFAMQSGDAKANELLAQGKPAEARAVYEALLVKYPSVFQLHPAIAKTYHVQNNFAKAAEHLKLYMANDPNNAPMKLMMGYEFAQAGNAEEAWAAFSTVDPAKVDDPSFFQDAGLSFLRQKKFTDAWKYFDVLVTQYSDKPDFVSAYYWRGFASWQIGLEKPDAPESKAQLEAAKADLNKFLSMATTGPEVANAKKILETIK